MDTYFYIHIIYSAWIYEGRAVPCYEGRAVPCRDVKKKKKQKKKKKKKKCSPCASSLVWFQLPRPVA